MKAASRSTACGAPSSPCKNAARRAQEIRAEDSSEGTLISTLIDSRPQGTTIWLVAAHRDVCEAVDFDLGLRGLRVDRLVPLALGLGAVNRLLRPARSHGLTAVLWLDVANGICVVSDRLGWLFDREIPLKYAGERFLRTDDAASTESDEEDQHVERLATELKRTFAYVERELDLGRSYASASAVSSRTSTGSRRLCPPRSGSRSSPSALRSRRRQRLRSRPRRELVWARRCFLVLPLMLTSCPETFSVNATRSARANPSSPPLP